MTLNYNSFTAKFYRYFYDDKNMPKSICPYFWKLTLAWLFVIPVTLFSIPAVIFEIFTKESYGLGRIFFSLLLYMVIFLVTSMVFTVMLFFNNYDSESIIVKMGSAGAIIWLFIIVASSIELFKYIKNRNSNNSSVIVGFVKSKYNKYCTKITWE